MKARKPKTKNFYCDNKHNVGFEKCKKQCDFCWIYMTEKLKNGMQ